MDSQPVKTHEPQDKDYMAEKLRGATVMYAPAVLLDLFEGISVLATAFGGLPDPKRSTAARILRPMMSVGALLPWVYLLIVRPWHLRWGATGEDVRKSLPGDDLVPHPTLESTRAVTIRAPVEEVWRWVVQRSHQHCVRGARGSASWHHAPKRKAIGEEANR